MKGTALLFDLDGTLIDSVPDLARALNALLAELGADPLREAEVTRMVGDGVEALVARGLEARDLPPGERHVARFLAHYEADPTALTRSYPGVPATLAALRESGWPLAVVTNKPERATRLVLEQLDLVRLFGAVIGGDTTPARKPDRTPLLAAMRALGTEDAIFIGDNENDAAAARAAGLPLVLMRYGYARRPVETLGAAVLLDRFDQLPAVLPDLAGRGYYPIGQDP